MTDFDQLPVPEQIQLVSKVAERALAEWGLEGAQLSLLKHRENSVFKVQPAAGEPTVMRVHRLDYHSDRQLASELTWLDSLREAGVQTTHCLRCRDGSAFAKVSIPESPGARQCDLLEWVPGQAIGSLEEGVELPGDSLRDVYRHAGEQAALIHNHGESWAPPADFDRLAWDERGYFGEQGAICGRYWDLESLAPQQLDLLHRARDAAATALADFGKTIDRYGLVHGDFLPENLFYDGRTVRLIDWDDTGYGWHLHDLATALFPHLTRDTLEPVLAAMVEGYRSQRPLPDEHLALLDHLVMARALSYVGWVASRPEAGRELAPMAVAGACHLAELLLQ